jgi:hypothetical protein
MPAYALRVIYNGVPYRFFEGARRRHSLDLLAGWE